MDKITLNIDSIKDSDKLISIIAHDLINPITGIMGFSELLIKEIQLQYNDVKKPDWKITTGISELDFIKHTKETNKRFDSITRHAGLINNSIKEVYTLLENLLDWSRSRNNDFSPSPESVSARDSAEEVIAYGKIPADIKNITITNEIEDDVYLTADKNMLKTILRNFISNAIKFTPRGGSIEITSSFTSRQNNAAKETLSDSEKRGHFDEPLTDSPADKRKRFVRINVTDSGIGIPETRLRTLLISEERFSTKGTESEKGTGLGLFVCRDFAKKMNGYLTVKSKRGKGSIFSVSLPSAGC